MAVRILCIFNLRLILTFIINIVSRIERPSIDGDLEESALAVVGDLAPAACESAPGPRPQLSIRGRRAQDPAPNERPSHIRKVVMMSRSVSKETNPTRFEALPIGEQLTVWATRMWARAHHDSPALHRNLHDAFRIARIPEGYLAFDRIMTVLCTASQEGIAIGCTCCTGVTDDEQVLLGIVAEFQSGTAARAHMVLEDWLPAAAARIAAEYFSEYALLIKGAGLQIRLRQWTRSPDPDMAASRMVH